MASRMLNSFILGTGLPSSLAVRTLPRIWATRGLASPTSRTSGERSSKRSTWPPREHDSAHQLGADRHAGAHFEVGG